MTSPIAAVTVAFRAADTGRASERVISVKDRSWRSNDEIAAEAIWIVRSWRNVDRDSVSAVKVERAEDLAIRLAAEAAERAGRAAV
jgi:hypothetical protein